MADSLWRTRATAFFEAYLAASADGYIETRAGRGLTDYAMCTCAGFLIAQGVFSSPEDMRRAALRGHLVILPDWVLNKPGEGKA